MNENSIENKIDKARKIISSVNSQAYKDIFLISNSVLSKDPLTSNFLNRFLNDDDPKQHRFYRIIYKLSSYYIKSALHFMACIVKLFAYYLSFFRFNFSKENKEFILIDTLFNMGTIRKSDSFKDSNFLGVEDILKKMDKHYAYLPFFSSLFENKRPFEIFSILKILKRDKVPTLCEYQLLSIYDLLYLLYFIIVYPFHVINLSRTLDKNISVMRLLKYELRETLDQVTFYGFLRYLIGRKIAKLPYEKIKVISWFENQAIHKNLYRGLRKNTAKVKIYGAQLFLYSKNYINMEADQNEERFGVIPDKILVNGTYFAPERSNLNYAVGPSLRYKRIFDTQVRKENQRNILVLLPYSDDDLENILQMLVDAKISHQGIFVKAHHGIMMEKYEHLIPSGATLVNDDIYKLFETTKIVIGAATGALLEAASLGIPAVTVTNTKRFGYSNPFPEYGRGVIWQEVSNSHDLIRQIDRFGYALDNNCEEIDVIANRYKQMFFCKVTDENIVKAFEL